MRSATASERGVTLMEIMIALGVLAIALFGLLSVISYVTRLNQNNKENMIALRAAERIIETMQSTAFSDIFRFYNSNPGDDLPDFPAGGAPGNTFHVERLPTGEPALRAVPPAAPGDPVGRIFFPGNGSTLREDVTDADFPDAGMPRDLNRNGLIDNGPVDTEYLLLPVRVEISWLGIQGPRRLTFHHMFVSRN